MLLITINWKRSVRLTALHGIRNWPHRKPNHPHHMTKQMAKIWMKLKQSSWHYWTHHKKQNSNGPSIRWKKQKPLRKLSMPRYEPHFTLLSKCVYDLFQLIHGVMLVISFLWHLTDENASIWYSNFYTTRSFHCNTGYDF